MQAVEEHFVSAEADVVRRGGGHGRENVGMSSKNESENLSHRKSKVSWATRIDPGLGNPKVSPVYAGVADGRAG